MGLVFILIILRTTSESLFPEMFRRWDLLLPIAVYLGQRRGFIEGATLVFIIAHFYTLSSVAPAGIFILHYGIIFLIAKGLLKFIYASTWSTVFGLTLFLALASRLILPLESRLFDHGWPVLSWGNLMIFNVLTNALAGIPLYFLLALLDRLTQKVAPAEILSEGPV